MKKDNNPLPSNYYYARNDFKRFMGYEEPDYLRVAGLYDSCERSAKSKSFNNILVKKADYVAKKLGWSTAEGKPDTKRAENAIRRACSMKNSWGIHYLYSVSNKNKCVTKSGAARVFMSGPRWLQYQEERKNAANTEKTEEEKLLEEYEGKVKQVLDYFNITVYTNMQLRNVTKLLLEKVRPVNRLDTYFNVLTSDWYAYQHGRASSCPHFHGIYDLVNKFDKLNHFYGSESLWYKG